MAHAVTLVGTLCGECQWGSAPKEHHGPAATREQLALLGHTSPLGLVEERVLFARKHLKHLHWSFSSIVDRAPFSFRLCDASNNWAAGKPFSTGPTF